MATFTTTPEQYFTFTLKVSRDEANSLSQSIYEALQIVDNWRSDPTLLREFKQEIDRNL